MSFISCDFNLEHGDILEQLKELLEVDSGEEVYYYQQFNNLFFSTSVNELMLRLVKPYGVIVIARVAFKTKRKGHLTKVIDLVSTVPWVTTLEMESVLSEEGLAYCTSERGFKLKEHSFNSFIKQIER